MKIMFEHKLLQICKDFLETYTNWNEPTIFELDGVNSLQAYEKNGWRMGIVQNNYSKKYWTLVYRQEVKE